MTDSAFRGPISNMGSMEDSPTSIQPEDGPIYTYQGVVFANLRGGAFQKDGNGNARVPAYLINPTLVAVDNIPSTLGTTVLAVAAAVTTGTGMTLLSVAPGNTTSGSPSHAPGVPIIPFGASAVTTVIALDFGFTTGTTTAGSSAVAVPDNTQFTGGQWLCIGGAGNAAKTSSLLTQVQSISTTSSTAITVLPAPAGSLSNAPVASGNLWNQFLPPATQYGPGTPVATAESNALAAGLFRIFNPMGALARNVTITATVATAAGGAFLVRGFDVHSQAMSETITAAAGTATAAGKKAFKFIQSVIPQFADATSALYSVGVGDVYGLPFRCDRIEYIDYDYAGVDIGTSTGIITAVTTNPATPTTGDVRGTIAISTASNGANRLFIKQTFALLNTIQGTPNNTAPILGVTQA